MVAPKINLEETNSDIVEKSIISEEVEEEVISEDDFVITEVAPVNVENILDEPEQVQSDLLFDLPLNTESEEKEEVRFNLKEESIIDVNEIEVYGAEEVFFERKEIEKRYVLEDFNAQPTIGKSSGIKDIEKRVVEEDVEFEIKTRIPEKDINRIETHSEEVSPLDLTITELQTRAEERRKKMKGFNYKFNDQMSKNIDEIERQPAYKRLGVNLDTDASISNKKTSIKKDTDEISLKSNNSFLHDNVD